MLERRTPLKRTPLRRKAVRKPSTAGASLKVSAIPARRADRNGDFSPKAKKEVRRRSMGWCEMPDCTRTATQFHHRLRRSQGGPGTADNCMYLCDHCHGFVHANPKLSYEKGWLVRSGVASNAG